MVCVQILQKQLIDADQALKWEFTAGIRSRGQQAMRNDLKSQHATVASIQSRRKQLFADHCPRVWYPGAACVCHNLL